MEQNAANQEPKVGRRCRGVIHAVDGDDVLLLTDLDFPTGTSAQGPSVFAVLNMSCTLGVQAARALRAGDRVEVVLVLVHRLGPFASAHVSLPADPAWLEWNGGTVRQLAQQIRGSGDSGTLPVLADALEEAGCDERELLTRCRRPENDDLTWLVNLLATQE